MVSFGRRRCWSSLRANSDARHRRAPELCTVSRQARDRLSETALHLLAAFVLAASRYVGANLALNSDWLSSTLESARSEVNLNRRAMAIRLSLVVNADSGIHRPTGWLLRFDGSRVAITDSDSAQHPTVALGNEDWSLREPNASTCDVLS